MEEKEKERRVSCFAEKDGEEKRALCWEEEEKVEEVEEEEEEENVCDEGWRRWRREHCAGRRSRRRVCADEF